MGSGFSGTLSENMGFLEFEIRASDVYSFPELSASHAYCILVFLDVTVPEILANYQPRAVVET